MTSATIKLFLPHGDAKRLRVGEVSNWTGKALAAPRTELEDLLAREELESSGVYFLLGVNPDTGAPLAYIGEAEVIRERLKQHKAKDFWNVVVVFVSKDENLTKAHIRFLENRLLQEAKLIGRYVLENTNSKVTQNYPNQIVKTWRFTFHVSDRCCRCLGLIFFRQYPAPPNPRNNRRNFSARSRMHWRVEGEQKGVL
jgi:hypothetical protein